jgi:ATP-dependent Lhr-like helicase
MQADDLLAAVFPGLAACQEHQAGPIAIPDHPLVRQTLHDCLFEAMDLDGLREVVGLLERGELGVAFVDTTEPSPLAHEILTARPYAFLDDAPLEERRTRAVVLRRGLPVAARELGRLDSDAIARVRDEASPQPRDAEELHDLLLTTVLWRPQPALEPFFDELRATGRVLEVDPGSGRLWVALERRRHAQALFPDGRFDPDPKDQPLPANLAAKPAPDLEAAVRETVRGHLEFQGPMLPEQLVRDTQLSLSMVMRGLAELEGEGFALRGHFDPDVSGEQFCARRLLTRIHLYTKERLRREIEPVSAQDFLRFLLRWQHATPDTRREGKRGVLAVVEQMQGFELPAGAWESTLLASRVEKYRPGWLDALCLSGEVGWGRLSPRDLGAPRARGGSGSPSRATPLGLVLRADLDWLLHAARGGESPAEPPPGAALELLEALRTRGALFSRDLAGLLGRLPVEVEQGLWDIVARGFVTADSFEAVRSLLGAREREAKRRLGRRTRRGLRRGTRGRARDGLEGRWSLLPCASPEAFLADELAEAVAEQLLARWGVVFRDLLARESIRVPWRELLYAFRRMEARGVIRGGRFVSGFVGEQYALPGAVDALRQTRRLPRDGQIVELSAADPLNLKGILTPGPRIPALRINRVVFCDGEPVDAAKAHPNLRR